MVYMKWDVEYEDHPQVVHMDWRGQVYFWKLCAISKAKQFRGVVPKSYASAAYVAARARASIEDMEAGRQQALDAPLDDEGKPLLEVLDDGSVFIPGWSNRQTDPTAKDRKRRQRQRKKQGVDQENSHAASRVTRRDTPNVTRDTPPVTVGHGGVTVHSVTVTTDRRLETGESEQELPPVPPLGGRRTMLPFLDLEKGSQEERVWTFWRERYHPGHRNLESCLNVSCNNGDRVPAVAVVRALAAKGNKWARRKVAELDGGES